MPALHADSAVYFNKLLVIKIIANFTTSNIHCPQLGRTLTSITADQYHLTVSRAQVRPIKVEYFLEVIRQQFTRFQMIAGSRVRFFKIHIKYVVFMSVSPRTITILISN